MDCHVYLVCWNLRPFSLFSFSYVQGPLESDTKFLFQSGKTVFLFGSLGLPAFPLRKSCQTCFYLIFLSFGNQKIVFRTWSFLYLIWVNPLHYRMDSYLIYALGLPSLSYRVCGQHGLDGNAWKCGFYLGNQWKTIEAWKGCHILWCS